MQPRQQSIDFQPLPPRGGPDASGSGGLKLAVGLSIGLSVGLLGQEAVKRIFLKEEPKVQEKVVPTIDPVLVQQLISQDRKVNELDNQLSQLREYIRERNEQDARANATPKNVAVQSTGNVFELSEIIQANNHANSAKYEKLLEDQRKALVREHLLKVEGEVLKVENKYRPVINKYRELEAHLESQRQLHQREAPARRLWLACQALLDRLRNAPQEPLENHPAYETLKQFAAENNPLAISILDSIPEKVFKEGVQSQETLSERFSRIDKLCKRVALVDAHGGGLGIYLLSYLQSIFIIDTTEVPEDEMVDPTKWTTFDILARVRHCLKSNNLEQAIRFANQLKGQARVVARDWIRDARLHLITRQAFNALSAHAEAMSVLSRFE